MNSFWKLIIAVAVSELAGVIGALFTTPSIPTWYAGLIKPALNPPAWVFGPVWTILFLLMGISAFLIWRQGLDQPQKSALVVFLFQLVLNLFWSVFFFGAHNIALALVWIIILWLAILWTISKFYKNSFWAGSLLIPYILWVSFATYLNYQIWILNR